MPRHAPPRWRMSSQCTADRPLPCSSSQPPFMTSMPREVRRSEEMVGDQTRPVRVRQVGDAALRRDPARGLGDARELLARLGQRVDSVGEHVGLEPAVDTRRELTRGDQQDVAGAFLGLVQRDQPVVGDRQHVVARTRVVLDETPGRGLPIGSIRVRVQLAAVPRTLALERFRHGVHGIRKMARTSAGCPAHPSHAHRERGCRRAGPLARRHAPGRGCRAQRAGAALGRREARRARRQRLEGRGQLLRPDHRLHRHGLGRDLRPALRAALLVRRRRIAQAERRGRDADDLPRRDGLHDPAAQGRALPQRPLRRRAATTRTRGRGS